MTERYCVIDRQWVKESKDLSDLTLTVFLPVLSKIFRMGRRDIDIEKEKC